MVKDYIDVKIYYEDTDAGGVVYYGKYLTYLEWARTVFLEARGINILELINQGINFVVVNVDITYHKPSKYGDIIRVYTKIEEKTFAAFTFIHKIVLKENEQLISSSKVKLACVNKSFKPIKLTTELQSLLSND
ncbi:4-hydroxybenzoyl-CoA thioesterase [Candidatus Magnetoovum chiemensis]|nr:4-hydroxybenzoyl-CoA thioesterase [Candidatus Magnetoovum chiemensis]